MACAQSFSSRETISGIWLLLSRHHFGSLDKSWGQCFYSLDRGQNYTSQIFRYLIRNSTSIVYLKNTSRGEDSRAETLCKREKSLSRQTLHITSKSSFLHSEFMIDNRNNVYVFLKACMLSIGAAEAAAARLNLVQKKSQAFWERLRAQKCFSIVAAAWLQISWLFKGTEWWQREAAFWTWV